MISATFVDALRRPLVSGKSPFEELSSAPGALKSTFSRHNSLVLNVLTDQAACEIQERGVVCGSGMTLDELARKWACSDIHEEWTLREVRSLRSEEPRTCFRRPII
jgi:hypothetical protein